MSTKINIRQDDLPYRNINLPTEVLTRCKDKQYLFKIAVSVFIKAHAGDSLFRGLSIRNIKERFGVGQTRAKKISAILKSGDELFRYDGDKDFAVASTFKNYAIHTTDKYGRRIKMMYAVRLKIDKSWNLKQVERYIHDNLYLKAINATERADKFVSSRIIQNNILLANKDALTLTKMKNIGGVCRSTANRHLDRMKSEGKISITRGKIQLVLTSLSDDAIKYAGLSKIRFIYNEKRWLGYIVSPNEYKIQKPEITYSFRNIIFNHSKRWTYNAPTKDVDIMDSERMGAYN